LTDRRIWPFVRPIRFGDFRCSFCHDVGFPCLGPIYYW